MKKTLLYLFYFFIIFSCNQKSDEEKSDQNSDLKNITLEKLDSIQIEYLGNPIVHDIDPKSKTVLFMEFEEFSNDIMLADFDGNVFNSFSKFGDMPDGYGSLLAPIQILGKDEILAFGLKGFSNYDFQGNLHNQVGLDEIYFPNFRRIAMGHTMNKLGNKYLYLEGGTRDIDYDKINLHSDIFLFNLLDPSTGSKEPIIQFPKTSIYKSGKYFFRNAWSPVFSVVENQVFIAFGGEPVIYNYSGESPFELISSLPIDIPNYRYFEGSNNENLEYDFIGLFLSSARIENIKKVGDYFLVAYFQGYDDVDREYFFANKTPDESKELRERLKEKYPYRLAIFDSLGKRLNDFSPEDYDPTSMLLRDGQLWVMEKPDPEVEKEYFRLYRVGLKGE
ncbi:hypothetical protein MM213_05020 [Belliella sp. R4-6]|uniref:DUF4221 domain-containing protein n=1 Tax=Belliella alkalica TaxID=1730871 RepID=A0ABS9VAA5_9BACT|nr:hypothetical protein [Belliella alkalica]MCH7412838.1 hypothetical protein [Belliella alkalica]